VDCHVAKSTGINEELHFKCTTSCAELFFTGGGTSAHQLVVFVLVPLMWVPFAVYCNNEVAQLVDGLWFQHQGAVNSGTVRIGLSTTAHGYRAVAPLFHAVVIVCCGVAIVWGKGGYSPQPPPGLTGDDHQRVTDALNAAGKCVTNVLLVLDLVMLLRVVVEITGSSVSKIRRGWRDWRDWLGDWLARLAESGSPRSEAMARILDDGPDVLDLPDRPVAETLRPQEPTPESGLELQPEQEQEQEMRLEPELEVEPDSQPTMSSTAAESRPASPEQSSRSSQGAAAAVSRPASPSRSAPPLLVWEGPGGSE
jgi:hypothetical protein